MTLVFFSSVGFDWLEIDFVRVMFAGLESLIPFWSLFAAADFFAEDWLALEGSNYSSEYPADFASMLLLAALSLAYDFGFSAISLFKFKLYFQILLQNKKA